MAIHKTVKYNLYIGDCHGDWSGIPTIVKVSTDSLRTIEGDKAIKFNDVVLVGDFGAFFQDGDGQKFLHQVEEPLKRIIDGRFGWIDGNHENHHILQRVHYRPIIEMILEKYLDAIRLIKTQIEYRTFIANNYSNIHHFSQESGIFSYSTHMSFTPGKRVVDLIGETLKTKAYFDALRNSKARQAQIATEIYEFVEILESGNYTNLDSNKTAWDNFCCFMEAFCEMATVSGDALHAEENSIKFLEDLITRKDLEKYSVKTVGNLSISQVLEILTDKVKNIERYLDLQDMGLEEDRRKEILDFLKSSNYIPRLSVKDGVLYAGGAGSIFWDKFNRFMGQATQLIDITTSTIMDYVDIADVQKEVWLEVFKQGYSDQIRNAFNDARDRAVQAYAFALYDLYFSWWVCKEMTDEMLSKREQTTGIFNDRYRLYNKLFELSSKVSNTSLINTFDNYKIDFIRNQKSNVLSSFLNQFKTNEEFNIFVEQEKSKLEDMFDEFRDSYINYTIFNKIDPNLNRIIHELDKNNRSISSGISGNYALFKNYIQKIEKYAVIREIRNCDIPENAEDLRLTNAPHVFINTLFKHFSEILANKEILTILPNVSFNKNSAEVSGLQEQLIKHILAVERDDSQLGLVASSVESGVGSPRTSFYKTSKSEVGVCAEEFYDPTQILIEELNLNLSIFDIGDRSVLERSGSSYYGPMADSINWYLVNKFKGQLEDPNQIKAIVSHQAPAFLDCSKIGNPNLVLAGENKLESTRMALSNLYGLFDKVKYGLFGHWHTSFTWKNVARSYVYTDPYIIKDLTGFRKFIKSEGLISSNQLTEKMSAVDAIKVLDRVDNIDSYNQLVVNLRKYVSVFKITETIYTDEDIPYLTIPVNFIGDMYVTYEIEMINL